jgi:hypothetical protein
VKAHIILSRTVSEIWHRKPATLAGHAPSPQLRPPPLVAWLGKLTASQASLSSIQHQNPARHVHQRLWLHPVAFVLHQTPCRPLVRATNTARSLAFIRGSVSITAATPVCEPAKHYTHKVLAKPEHHFNPIAQHQTYYISASLCLANPQQHKGHALTPGLCAHAACVPQQTSAHKAWCFCL